MREGHNPLADRIALLTRSVSIPKEVSKAIERDELSEALKAANQWYARSRSAGSAIAYACTLTYRGLDAEARGVLLNARESAETASVSLDLLWAESALLNGDVEEALAQIERLKTVDRDPGQSTFLAEVLFDLGQDQASEETLEDAIQNGGTLTAARMLFSLRSERGDAHGAAEALALAGKFAPDDRALWTSIAAAWEEAGDYRNAVKAYERVLKLGVDFYQLAPAYTDALLHAGDYEGARKTVARMREYDDEDPELIRVEAEILWQMGRGEDARTRLESLVKADEAFASDVILLSMCWQAVGDVARQERVLKTNLALGPDEIVPALVRCLLSQGRVDASQTLADEHSVDSVTRSLIAIHAGGELVDGEMDDADRFELLEAAVLKRRADVVQALSARPFENGFVPWVGLLTAAIEETAPSSDHATTPVLWDTTTLAEIGERLPDPPQTEYFDALGALEQRMVAYPNDD